MMVQQDFSLDKTLLSLWPAEKKKPLVGCITLPQGVNSQSGVTQPRKNLLHVLCPKPKLDPGTKVGHLHGPSFWAVLNDG